MKDIQRGDVPLQGEELTDDDRHTYTEVAKRCGVVGVLTLLHDLIAVDAPDVVKATGLLDIIAAIKQGPDAATPGIPSFAAGMSAGIWASVAENLDILAGDLASGERTIDNVIEKLRTAATKVRVQQGLVMPAQGQA